MRTYMQKCENEGKKNQKMVGVAVFIPMNEVFNYRAMGYIHISKQEGFKSVQAANEALQEARDARDSDAKKAEQRAKDEAAVKAAAGSGDGDSKADPKKTGKK